MMMLNVSKEACLYAAILLLMLIFSAQVKAINEGGGFQQLQTEFEDELDNEFDNIEATLENEFLQTDAQLEARFLAVHKAIQAAYSKQTAKIEVQWPDDVVVPNGAVWVAYSEDYKERIVYDFEQGIYEIEVAASVSGDDPEVSSDSVDAESLTRLAKLADEMSLNQPSTLGSLDVFSRAIEQEVSKVEPLVYQQSLDENSGLIDTNTAPQVRGELARVRPKADKYKAVEASKLEKELLTISNYEVLASVSPVMPKLDVQSLLARITNANVNANTEADISSSAEAFEQNRKIILSTDSNVKSDKPESDKPIKPNTVANVEGTNLSTGLLKSNAELTKTASGWSLKIPFVNRFQETLIDQRMQTINTASERFDVDVSLILAIIEAESSFNPMATSHIPAFGLMQLVPQTAGVDAYRHVYGKRKILSPDYLYDIENNLKLGTAYIDLLQTRYLRGITSADNKLYSMIASYNTGVGNLAKTVSGQNSIRGAISHINDMQPSDYYSFLQDNLPALETKRYLAKVITNRQKYQHLDK